MNSLKYLLVLLTVFLALGVNSSKLSAYVDKNEIEEGESIRLTVSYSGNTSDRPDFAPLTKDFEILSNENRSQTSIIINGKMSAETSWILELFPKNTDKELIIPKITLGGYESNEIKIMQVKSSGDLLIDVDVDKKSLYINAQLVLTIKIKTRLSLHDGSISMPEISNAIIETIVENSVEESIENGIRYQIYKRVYAVFPSKVGELSIPPVLFRGVSADRRRGQSFGFGGFFDRGKRVQVRSNPITLEVKDIPPEYPKDKPFLPLKNLVIAESLDDPDHKLTVNKAATRRFDIKILGGLASSLPKVVTPSISALQVYGEEGNAIQKIYGQNIESSTSISHVYMPILPGEIVVPKQEIYWWDTEKDQLRTTVIRDMKFMVSGDSVALPKPDTSQIKQEIVENKKSDEIILAAEDNINTYKILFIVAIILWLLTLMLLFMRIKRTGQKQYVQENTTLAQLVLNAKNSCKSRDAKKVYVDLQKLKQWAEKNSQDHVADKVSSYIRELEQVIYQSNSSIEPNNLFSSLMKTLGAITCHTSPKRGLKDLYPL